MRILGGLKLLLFAVTILAGSSNEQCVRSLIVGGVDSNGYDLYSYNPRTKVLQCKDAREIVYNGDRYKKLICNIYDGWKDPDTGKTVLDDPGQQIRIDCKEEILKCDRKLIDGGVDSNGNPLYSFLTATKELKCLDEKEIVFNGNRYATLKCDKDNGWKDNKKVIAQSSQRISIDCKEKRICDISLLKGPIDPSTNQLLYTFIDRNLQCSDNKMIVLNGEQYAKLICTEDGWRIQANEAYKDSEDNDDYVEPFEYTAKDEINFDCDGTRPTCDISLLKSEITAFTFSPSKELQCKDKKEIEISGVRYAKLICKSDQGWLDPTQTKVVIRDPSDSIKVICRIKACDSSLITKTFFNEETKYDSATNKLTCENSLHTLNFIDKNGNWNEADSIKCDNVEWNPSGVANTEEINVKCEHKKCHKSLITNHDVSSNQVNGKISLSCAKSDNFIEIETIGIEKIRLTKIMTCESRFANYWLDENNKIVLSSDRKIEVRCTSIKCHKGLVNMGEGVLRVGNTITCTDDNKELFIQSKNLYMTKIECDENLGWNSDDISETFDADAIFYIQCTEKTCQKSMITFGSKVDFKGGLYPHSPDELVCTDNTQMLIVDDEAYEKLTCVKGGSWTDGFNVIGSQTFTVNCVAKECHPSLTKSIDEAEIEISGNNPLTLACINKYKELQYKGINGIYYYGFEFVCDKTRGWLREETKIAEADEKLQPNCIDRSCDISLIVSSTSTQFSLVRQSEEDIILSCKNDAYFYVNDAFHKKLNCKKNDYWTTQNFPSGPKTYIVSANDNLFVDCVFKECHESLQRLGKKVRKDGNKLSCSSENLELHIDGTNIYSKTLVCDHNEGWKTAQISTEIKANEEIKIDCVGKACDRANVELINNKVRINDPNNKLLQVHAECTNKKESLHMNDAFHDSLQCFVKHGWMSTTEKGGVIPLNIGPREKVTIGCRMSDRCDHEFIEGDKTKYTFKYTDSEKERILKCTKKDHTLIVDGVLQMEELVCDIAENLWKPTGLPGDAKLTVVCNKLCDYKAINEIEVKRFYNIDEVTQDISLKCKSKNEVPHILIYKDKKYTDLKCSMRDGWVNENNEPIAKAETKLELECEKYCRFKHSSVNFPNSEVKNNRRIVSSSNKLYAIFPKVNHFNVKPFDTLTCSYKEGWIANGVQVSADTFSSFALTSTTVCKYNHGAHLNFDGSTRVISCKSGMILSVNGVPSPPLKCDPEPGWYDDKFPSLKRFHHDRLDTLKTKCNDPIGSCGNIEASSSVVVRRDGSEEMYSCRNSKLNEEDNAIKLNGVFVHSQLYCDPGRGWTDVDRNWLANAKDFKKNIISCETIKCKANSAKVCPNPSTAPPDYECIPHDFDADPDPNLRKCGENERILVTKDKKQIIVSGLRCSDDGSWHEIGDDSKKTVAMGSLDISCVQKRCSKCASAPESPISISDEYVTSVPTFTTGSSDSCAKITCPNNLWLVENGDQKEEYNGNIVCSSDASKDSKWIFDEFDIAYRTAVEKAVCIEEMKHCENGITQGTESNCVVTEDGKLCECSAKKHKLFYKSKDATTYENIIQVQCDRKKGWIAKYQKAGVAGFFKVLKSDTVKCAESNPNPNITITRPIVQPKPQTACDFCPHPSKISLECGECSSKVLDIELMLSQDDEKCIAKSVLGGSFHTELQGDITGQIECDKSEKVWKYNGAKIGRVAALQKKEKEAESNLVTIIACCSFGVVVLVILLILAYKVFISKQKAADNSGSNPRSGDDKKKGDEKKFEDDVVA